MSLATINMILKDEDKTATSSASMTSPQKWNMRSRTLKVKRAPWGMMIIIVIQINPHRDA